MAAEHSPWVIYNIQRLQESILSKWLVSIWVTDMSLIQPKPEKKYKIIQLEMFVGSKR
jgi:hypothetical protein